MSGNYNLVSGDYSFVDSSYYQFLYIITLTRLPNTSPSDYDIFIGFYGMDFVLDYDDANGKLHELTTTNKQTTAFSITSTTSDPSFLISIKISYLAFSYQLGYFYL